MLQQTVEKGHFRRLDICQMLSGVLSHTNTKTRCWTTTFNLKTAVSAASRNKRFQVKSCCLTLCFSVGTWHHETFGNCLIFQNDLPLNLHLFQPFPDGNDVSNKLCIYILYIEYQLIYQTLQYSYSLISALGFNKGFLTFKMWFWFAWTFIKYWRRNIELFHKSCINSQLKNTEK